MLQLVRVPMSDKHLEEAVRSAVEQALERQISLLREKVVADVLRELGSGAQSSAEQTSAVALPRAGGGALTGTRPCPRTLTEPGATTPGRAARGW